MKNAGVFLFVFCCVAAAHARSSGHERTCELEPIPLPPPAPLTGEKPAPKPGPTPTNEPEPDDDRADMDVEGTLARVAPKDKMRVTVWAKNRGTAPWTPKDVRIIVRWVDFDSGTRRRWSYNWIKEVVPPLGQIRQSFEITAPPKAGRYKVIFGLVRVPVGGKAGEAPPYDAPQDKWPGEFAAVAFAVNVGDAATPDP